jgi:rhodanese-related sulfurtransferase
LVCAGATKTQSPLQGTSNAKVYRITKARRPLLIVILLGMALLIACGGGVVDSRSGSGDADAGAPEKAAPTLPAASGKVGERITVPSGSYTRISPAELKSMMQREDFVLVNTHVPFEGNIPGTDLSIPYDEIGSRAHRLPRKDVRIAVYCRSGRMSAEAARTLVEVGYTDVWDLGGGMRAWEKAGFPLEDA